MTPIILRLSVAESRAAAIAEVCAAVLAHPSVADAAAVLGMSKRSLYRVLGADVELRAAVVRARRVGA